MGLPAVQDVSPDSQQPPEISNTPPEAPSREPGRGWERGPGCCPQRPPAWAGGGHPSEATSPAGCPAGRPRQRCDTCRGRGLWQQAPRPFPPHHHRRRDPAPRPRPRGCRAAGQRARGPRSLYGWFTANSTLVPTVVGRPPQPLPGSRVYVLRDLLGGNPTTKR